MRRALVAVLIGVLAVAVWLAPAPEPVTVELPVTTATAGPVVASNFSNCAWAIADDTRETLMSIVTLSDVEVQLTFPVAGEIRETYPESLPGPGASAIPLSTILSLGVSPAVVEFSDSPAAAGVIAEGEGSLAGDLCPSSASKVWVLPGGTTVQDRPLDLQLFNPFPEDALVTVEAISEEGFEPVPDLERVSIPGRSWRTLALGDVLPFRQRLSVTVRTEQGRIIPAMVQTNGTDQAIWTDVGRSEVWEFPLVAVGELQPFLAIANAGPLEVTYTLDVFTADGPVESAVEGLVPAEGHDRISVAGLADGAYAVRLRADGPVSAVVVGEGEGQVAATSGAPLTARQWMLPGAGANSSAQSSLWFLNTGADSITVTYQLLDAGGTVDLPSKVALPAGTVRRVPLDQIGVSGVIAESTGLFSAAWSAETELATAYASGIPVGE
ncbi:MAG: DUF5719 family protein [Acidimicrobiia bacterium]|nr:DUF5719 family protein [Acidimicrobiia bacterium]